MTNRTIQTGTNYRALEFLSNTIDEESRTVQVRFSSEYPVARFIDGMFGDEILDHDPQSVDLGRLTDGGPVLMDHDSRDQVGVVENATIDSDRVGRAVLRFGKSQRASEVFEDIKDGVRRSLSVGYMVKKYITEKAKDSVIFRAISWEPFEITLTAVPADPTAQVGRSDSQTYQTEVIEMSEETDTPETKTEVVDVKGERERVRRAELDRVANIRKAGEKFECADLAERAVDQEWSIEQMNAAVLEHVAEKAARSEPVTKIGMTDKEVQGYSLMRAIRAHLANDWSKAGFELETSIAIEDAVGRSPQGFYIPYEIQASRSMPQYNGQRVMTVGTDTAGGFLKGTDHLAGSFIDLLRANALLGRLNARFLPGLVGDVDIPRLDGGIAFNWVTEDADGSLDDGVLGQVALSPKTVTGQVPLSRRLIKQSTPAVEQLLLDDMAAGAALAIDLAGFEGSGAAGQPTGITNTAGVATSTVADVANGIPTHVELVEFETDVLAANALMGTLAYVTTAPVSGLMKTTKLDAGSAVFMNQNMEANGYPIMVSTQLSAQRIIFGNFEDVLIGMWGVLDVEPDKAAKAAAGGLVLRVFQDVDIGIRHSGSFCIDA